MTDHNRLDPARRLDTTNRPDSTNRLDPARRLAGLRPERKADYDSLPSPYWLFDRESWASLADHSALELTEKEIERLRGLGDTIDLDEVRSIYLPLSQLLNVYVAAREHKHQMTREFFKPLIDHLHDNRHDHPLEHRPNHPHDNRHNPASARTPFVIGVAGSVAVGKSTTARVLREMLSRWPGTPRVELITTDGFLFPNQELARRGLSDRKGFPESYDRRRLLRFLAKVKSGAPEARAPVYSHHTYDIIEGAEITIRSPDVLIVEGLNVLQAPRPRTDGRIGIAVSDFFDFSVYVDANAQDIRDWYITRFLRLKEGAFTRPDSFFHRFSTLTDDEAITLAGEIWDSINAPNLVQNVAPSRGRADLILKKAADHKVRSLQLRKL